MISSIIGLIPNEIVVSYAGGFFREREGLGFTYTTFAPNYFFSIVIEWFFLNQDKKKSILWSQRFFIILINLFLYKKTGTRATFLFVMCIVLIDLVNKVNRFQSFFGKSVVKKIYIIMPLTSLFLSIFYNSSVMWMSELNDILSQRLRYSQMGLANWGISLFGKSVLWNTNPSEYNYIDSSYINILVCYGGLVFIILIIGFSIAVKYACRISDRKLAGALFIWAVRAAIDPQLFLMWFDPFLFYIGVSIFNRFKNYRGKEKCYQ